MTTAKTSGFISGAAGGAAIGSSFGAPGAIVGGVIGGVTGLFGGSAQDAAQANQEAWQQYNAITSYNTAIDNIGLNIDLGEFNTTLAELEGDLNSSTVQYTANVNADIIAATTSYNDLLYDADLEKLWTASGLDLHNITNQRAVERGHLVAAQGASGTIIGTGSNKDVVIDQTTQEYIDRTVVKYNADVKAADILNAQSQSNWRGQLAEAKTKWDGEMSAYTIKRNAAVKAFANTQSTVLTAIGNLKSATSSLSAGNAQVAINSSTASARNTQNMVAGLFSAAGTYASPGHDLSFSSGTPLTDTPGPSTWINPDTGRP